MYKAIQIRNGGCCGCGCAFAIIIPIIFILLFISAANWLSDEQNVTELSEKIEQRFEGEETEITSEQKDVIDKALKAIQTNDLELFKSVSSKNITEYYRGEGESVFQTTNGVFAATRDSFNKELGSNYEITINQYTGKSIDLYIFKGVSVCCTGYSNTDESSEPLAISMMLTTENDEWKVMFVEINPDEIMSKTYTCLEQA